MFHIARVPQLVRINDELNQDTQMQDYQIHTIETAPEKSKPLLELFIHAVGFVPNLAGAVANSPVWRNPYWDFFKTSTAEASLRPRSRFCS